jgi:glutamate racemase
VVGVEPGVKPAAAHVTQWSHRCPGDAVDGAQRASRTVDPATRRQRPGRIEACPGWATRVETLCLDDPDFVEEARRHLAPLLAAGVDQIVLGCTHYAFLCPVLEPIVAKQATLVDVADAVARQCVRLAGADALGQGQLTLLATAQPERLQAALPVLGLNWLDDRLYSAARLVVA